MYKYRELSKEIQNSLKIVNSVSLCFLPFIDSNIASSYALFVWSEWWNIDEDFHSIENFFILLFLLHFFFFLTLFPIFAIDIKR